MPRSFRVHPLPGWLPPGQARAAFLATILLVGVNARVWAEPPPPPPAAEAGAEGSFVFILDDAAHHTLIAPTLRIIPTGVNPTDIAMTDDGALSIDTPADHVWIGVGRFSTGAKVNIQVWDTSRQGAVTQTQQLALSLPGTDGAQVRIDAAPPAGPPGTGEAPGVEEVPRPSPPSGEENTSPAGGSWGVVLGLLFMSGLAFWAWPRLRTLRPTNKIIRPRRFSVAQLEAWGRGLDTSQTHLVLPDPDIPSTLRRLLDHLGATLDGELWVVSDQDPRHILPGIHSAPRLAPRLRWLKGSDLSAAELDTQIGLSLDPRVVVLDASCAFPPVKIPNAAGWERAHMDDVCLDLATRQAVEVWVVWMELDQRDLALGTSRPERFRRWHGLWTLPRDTRTLVGFEGEVKATKSVGEVP